MKNDKINKKWCTIFDCPSGRNCITLKYTYEFLSMSSASNMF